MQVRIYIPIKISTKSENEKDFWLMKFIGWGNIKFKQSLRCWASSIIHK